MSAAPFGERLAAEFARGRHLCAGIDPHAELLSAWGTSDDAAGAERMGRDVVAAAAGVAACVKPQIAFFERFGSEGYRALERIFADARDAGVMVIADVKRGDIGSSFGAYAAAWLGTGSPLEADAMTVAAYQGFGTLSAALERVRDDGKGLFVLAATSNPEAQAVQAAMREDGVTVASSMVADAEQWNRSEQERAGAARSIGSVGVVLGATLRLRDFGIDTERPRTALPVLAPGFGHQGARIEDAASIFGTLGSALLANESRSILSGGPERLAARLADRANAIGEALAA